MSKMETPREADAILRTCSYHRGTYYFPLFENDLSDVPESLGQFFDSPTSRTGILGRLPAELVAIVASHMDIISFQHFRQVSRYARAVATGVPEYQQVLQHGLEGVKALLHGNEFSYKTLYNVLITPNCELCGSFGGLLFLPTCTRCCFNCLKTAPELAILEKRLIDVWYPRMIQGPGGYQLSEVEQALESKETRSLSIHETLKRTRDQWTRVKLDAVLASDVFKAYGTCGDIDEEAVKVLEKAYFHLRLGSCIGYPWLNLKTASTERGVSCKGCHAAYIWDKPDEEDPERVYDWPNISPEYHDRDRAFSKQGFQVHFKSCEYAQKLWSSSDGGTITIQDDVFVKRGGCYWSHWQMGAYKRHHISGWMLREGPMWLGPVGGYHQIRKYFGPLATESFDWTLR
ncbi:hypothetical protein NW762_010519 [Fusarium torreyae]|uniref:F-box domain-containing protein n=1 Tax=Fusarium torreyae TaxID=1237075 RepID=A0A9W8RVF8_9HYPO|nr:hypothetical protein NW762_010519 [Fusarium torreyae]